MTTNLDRTKIRDFVIKIGYQKDYVLNSDGPIVFFDGKPQNVEMVFSKADTRHYLRMDAGEETINSNEARELEIRIVADATKGFILAKDEKLKKLYEESLNNLKSTGKYDNVMILTWDEYKSKADKLH